jgi:hypothetical protein
MNKEESEDEESYKAIRPKLELIDREQEVLHERFRKAMGPGA